MLRNLFLWVLIALVSSGCSSLKKTDYNISSKGYVGVEAIKRQSFPTKGNSKIEITFLDEETKEPISDILNVLYVNGIKVCSPIENGTCEIYIRFYNESTRDLFFEGLSPGYTFTKSKLIKFKQGYDYKIKMYLNLEY